MSSEIILHPIGVIHSPFKIREGTPIQPKASGEKGEIKIFPKYAKGLTDLDGFSHIIVLYFFHRQTNVKLQVIPFLDVVERGVFATRSPARPNHIGLSVVKLEKIIDDRLLISNVDMLDKTPVLDIKPYIPNLDEKETVKIGWLEDKIHKSEWTKDDGRFKSAHDEK